MAIETAGYTNAPETPPPFTIPTVDLSSYLQNPDSAEAQEVVDQIRDACTTSGFFQITGHGVGAPLQKAVFEAAGLVFGLPVEEKMKLKGKNARGYEVMGTQTLQEGAKPDLKEGYAIGPSVDVSPPYRDFAYPNIWPPSSLIPESAFRDPLTSYHDVLTSLSLTLMTILGRGLAHLDTTAVFKTFCTNPLAALKLLHYPPQHLSRSSSSSEEKEKEEKEEKEPRQFGAGAHTDFGAITLLLQDRTAGLQVLNRNTGHWIDVPPTEGAYVVNVGDMLEMWTRGLYKSNLHRVINRSGVDRYSAPFFFDGNLDCGIEPLDGGGAGDREDKGEVVTVEGYLRSRYRAVFLGMK